MGQVLSANRYDASQSRNWLERACCRTAKHIIGSLTPITLQFSFRMLLLGIGAVQNQQVVSHGNLVFTSYLELWLSLFKVQPTNMIWPSLGWMSRSMQTPLRAPFKSGLTAAVMETMRSLGLLCSVMAGSAAIDGCVPTSPVWFWLPSTCGPAHLRLSELYT